LLKSNARQYEQSFRAMRTLEPMSILSETVILEEKHYGRISWGMLETRIYNDEHLRDMPIIGKLGHCLNVLHYHIHEHYDYPFFQFTMGDIV
jgi:hypothetical protein